MIIKNTKNMKMDENWLLTHEFDIFNVLVVLVPDQLKEEEFNYKLGKLKKYS